MNETHPEDEPQPENQAQPQAQPQPEDKPEAESRPRQEPMTICSVTGQVAGKITRQIYELIAQMDRQCVRLGKMIYGVARPARAQAAAPETPADPEAKRRGRRPAAERLREERQVFLSLLGAQVARLKREQVQDVLSQAPVQELIAKIDAVEQALAARPKKRKA